MAVIPPMEVNTLDAEARARLRKVQEDWNDLQAVANPGIMTFGELLEVDVSPSKWLRAHSTGAIGVDRENNIIRGFVVAQEGPFKSEGRGEFDDDSLLRIHQLLQEAGPAGLKSRFTHPTLSDDGLGKFLGRARDPDFDVLKNGLNVVRADLHLSSTSFDTPNGNLGKYVLDLADDDPDAMSSSLVLKVDEEEQLDTKGKPLLDEDGEQLPPLWRPTALHAIDVVDTGDAVDGFLSAQLSADGLPDEVVRQASALLSKQFAGRSRQFVKERVLSWLDRYLDLKFDSDDAETITISQSFNADDFAAPDTDTLRRKNRLRKMRKNGLTSGG